MCFQREITCMVCVEIACGIQVELMPSDIDMNKGNNDLS